jgi:hypothetical protein
VLLRPYFQTTKGTKKHQGKEEMAQKILRGLCVLRGLMK